MTNWKMARLGAWLLGATALVSPAFAADKPADPAGAKALADFAAAYLGKAAATSLKIAAEGSSYVVSLDIGAATASMKGAGFAYEPAELKFRVFQQDDGQWRIENAALPPLVGHMKTPDGGKADVKIEFDKLTGSTVIDPKLGWVASGKASADKIRMTQHAPGVDQYIEIGKLKADTVTKAEGAGLTTTVTEPFETFNLVMDVDPKGVEGEAKAPAKPTHISAEGKDGAVEIALRGFKPGPLTDFWRFLAAHPERADYARDFEALKTTVNAVLGDAMTVDESIRLAKLNVVTEIGPVEIGDATIKIGAVNAGAVSVISERFAAKSIKLPEGLVPALYAPVIPTSFDIGFKASGLDLPAAAQEWFANANFEGTGLVLTREQQTKVMAKLVGSKPLVIDILPSKVLGPSLNIALEGKVTIDNTQPSGSVTIQVRKFDETAAAIQKLGPDAEAKLVPVIAMAKGLGKPGADGAMVWICDLGRDKVIKINGLPLGKAPF
jgi:hypothetical protein